MSILSELRAQGVVVTATAAARLRVSATTPRETVASIRESRDALLDALQDEAEEEIVGWPQAYRCWLVQTIGFALREGFATREAFWMAYRDLRAALEVDRARVLAEAHDDPMLEAALASGFATADGLLAGEHE